MSGHPTLIKMVAERVTHLAKCSTCRERLRTGGSEQLEVTRAQPVAQPYRLVSVPQPMSASYEPEHRRAA